MYKRTSLAAHARTLRWNSLSFRLDENGYSVFEHDSRFMKERMAEGVLRLTGAFLILAGYVQWFIPENLLSGDPVMTRTILTFAFMGVGWALYTFASRGFRRQVEVDLVNRNLILGRLNARNRIPFRHKFALIGIESIFVRRSDKRGGMATLCVLLKGTRKVLPIVQGQMNELETLHAALCKDVKIALTHGPRRVGRRAARPFGTFTPRPNRRKVKLPSSAQTQPRL